MDYYTSRRVDLVELLLSSENFAQLFARAHYISWSIHRDREDLAELAGEEAAHAEKTVELEARRDELKGLRMEKSQESIRLEARAKETKIETSRVERELETHRQELKDLEAREARTTRLLTELEAKRSGGGFAGDGIEASKGRLPWPVDGRVVTGFGSQVHPRFKTRILNRGIDVAAARGTPIHAVGPGVVAVADWLSGYGNCVILDHGKGFYTLYAHAEEILVAKGQNVRQGDVLARVGETDSVRGPGLHFEVRRGADALDPTLWLKRR
jgi:murein DD-endopeptidase MepM/ murein hydrolase activator NlpD